MSDLRLALAGDRDIAVWVLDFLLSQDVQPLALLLPDDSRASHAQELRARCANLSEENILVGELFRGRSGIAKLQSLQLDYILGVHFPYTIPETVLNASGRGFINLHPAYLPFNRGWHTPTWAILEGTPIGATLHFMDKSLDTGDIIHQKQLEISDCDTADGLYRKLKQLELEVFQEAWPQLLSGQPTRIPQDPKAGTFHRRRDLFQPQIQQIGLDEPTTARQLLTRWRALTTNRIDEAAFFEGAGKRYRVQIVVTPESE
jgi:methionyl-tRNA formyltransferase